jgi:hypothetical protein
MCIRASLQREAVSWQERFGAGFGAGSFLICYREFQRINPMPRKIEKKERGGFEKRSAARVTLRS